MFNLISQDLLHVLIAKPPIFKVDHYFPDNVIGKCDEALVHDDDIDEIVLREVTIELVKSEIIWV